MGRREQRNHLSPFIGTPVLKLAFKPRKFKPEHAAHDHG
jgi:hypothetical protein